MLQRHIPNDDSDALTWEDLSRGVATLGALARICGRSFGAADENEAKISANDLSQQAQTILYAGRDRGVVEIKRNHDEFDAVDRFLTVFVETAPHKMLAFKNNGEPEKTIEFVEAFRELCRKGLIMHHAQKDFSFTKRAFEIAKSIDVASIAESLEFASEENS